MFQPGFKSFNKYICCFSLTQMYVILFVAVADFGKLAKVESLAIAMYWYTIPTLCLHTLYVHNFT